MKKFLAIAACSLIGFAAIADTYTFTATLTNGQPITYSDPLPVSGYLEKIEVSADVASTTTVTVATYTSGNQALDTYATKAISAVGTNATAVFRTRVLGTDNAATALSAAGLLNNTTNTYTGVGTSLVAGYERPMLGGNVKVALTGTANDGSCPVTVTLFYLPTPK